jgi:hypothetical protein
LTSTFFNMHALDGLLLERFGGKVGRGLALQSCGRRASLIEDRGRASADGRLPRYQG